MQWEAVSASAAVIVPVATLLWYLNGLKTAAVVRTENDKLIDRINGTYLRSAGSRLTGVDAERRITETERKLEALHDYAHDRTHDLANQIAAVSLRSLP